MREGIVGFTRFVVQLFRPTTNKIVDGWALVGRASAWCGAKLDKKQRRRDVKNCGRVRKREIRRRKEEEIDSITLSLFLRTFVTSAGGLEFSVSQVKSIAKKSKYSKSTEQPHHIFKIGTETTYLRQILQQELFCISQKHLQFPLLILSSPVWRRKMPMLQ